MNHARNFMIFLWLALASSFFRNIGLSDGFFAIFGSLFLLLVGFLLLGMTIVYFMLRDWLRAKTSIPPSPNFHKVRKALRFVPIVPTIVFFLFAYNTEYGQYVKMYRDMDPTPLERMMDALGGTLSLTFVIYAVFELFLFALRWNAKGERHTTSA